MARYVDADKLIDYLSDNINLFPTWAHVVVAKETLIKAINAQASVPMKLCQNCQHFHVAKQGEKNGAGYCDVSYQPTYGGAYVEECKDYTGGNETCTKSNCGS